MNEPVPKIRTKLSPKANFIRDGKKADAHQEVMLSPQFQHAAQVALAEYACQLASLDVSMQATSGLKLQGARAFAETLMNLGVPEMPSAYSDDSTELRPI